MAKIKKSTLTFLRQLKRNNDREWFAQNRGKYEAARENMIDFADALYARLSETDMLEERTGKKALHRIYRDTRFSKDKTPYKRNFSGRFTRDGRSRRGGYYFQVVPQGLYSEDPFMRASAAGGGFYGPEREDLKRIRQELAADQSEFLTIVNDPDFRRLFGEMQGAQLKTAPQGYPKDHPHIKLLRYKSFYAMRYFTDEEVLSEHFVDLTMEAYTAIRPFFDYFSDILTTDANGEPLF